MTDDLSAEDEKRSQAAKDGARSLDYTLFTEEIGHQLQLLLYAAFAAPRIPGQGTNARYLASGASRADAAEAGLERLRGIVERGDPWPE